MHHADSQILFFESVFPLKTVILPCDRICSADDVARQLFPFKGLLRSHFNNEALAIIDVLYIKFNLG